MPKGIEYAIMDLEINRRFFWKNACIRTGFLSLGKLIILLSFI